MSTGAAPRAVPRRAELLGVGAYLALFLGVHLVLASASGGLTPGDAVELALIGVAAVAVAVRRTLPMAIEIGCVLALVAAAAIGTWMLPPVPQGPDYRAWSFGAVTFVALGLALRQRYAAAWLTLLCTAAVAVGWSVDVGIGPMVGTGLVIRHVGTLAAGTLLAIALHRSQRSAEAFEAAERQERTAAEAARARQAARQATARTVLEAAGPLLTQLAEGRPLAPEDRRELLVVEGSLRDRIRAPGLLRDDLPDQVAAARRRGMDVLLLDEEEGRLSEEERMQAATWLAERIAATGGARFVGRLGTRDGVARVTAVTDEGSDSLVLAPDRVVVG